MKRISKICLFFFISVIIILILPYITAGEEWATYGNETNVSYPDKAINCSFGQVHPNQSAFWCWINFSEKEMDHSFFDYSSMDNYYNSSGDNLIIGGDTYTLSSYQEPNIAISSDPGMLSGIFAFIRGLFL